jgi:cobalt-zinc-cadmium efflux system membrane fusion protein
MTRTVRWTAFVLLAAGAAAGGLLAAARLGWQPPPWLGFLSQRKGTAPADVGLFCQEHGVPEKFCTLCHDELKSKLVQCAEHGLPEEICTLCHPEAKEKYAIAALCTHGLPQHFCTQCNPSLRAEEAPGDWCLKHLVPQSLCTLCSPEREKSLEMCAKHALPALLCTICRPELASSLPTCKLHRLPVAYCKSPECQTLLAAAVANGSKATLPLVRLAAAGIASEAGLETAAVQSGTVLPTVRANGVVAFDETRMARIRPRVSGIVLEVLVREGDPVERGQTLLVMDSSELGEAKADYLASVPLVQLWTKTVERSQSLSEKGLAAAKEVLEAEAELELSKARLVKARQRLRNLGLDDDQLERLSEEKETERNRHPVRAPLQGTVLRRKCGAGEAIESASELFTVGDLSSVWVHFDVFEKDLGRVAVGQSVRFRVRDLGPVEFQGEVIWIGPEVNDRTRTVPVRAQVANPKGLLRANMFGTGEIQIEKPRTSLLVPKTAVQWEGASFVVFRGKGAGVYEPRRVLIGQRAGTLWELAWSDLQAGDSVVTTGSFLLKTEIQKGSIGAGCCGE